VVSASSDTAAAWISAARRGDFAAAWAISDAVLAEHVAAGPCWSLPRHEQWVWDGRDLTDRSVLVRCYHGLGDTIQFARFLPVLARRARQVTVWAQPMLLPLLRTMPGLCFLPLHDGPPPTGHEVDIEIMELAHALRITLATLPPPARFAVAPAARLADEYSVGVVAASGDWDERRSVADQMLAAALVDVPRVRLFSLQLGRPLPGMPDASSPDILTLASRLLALDLVITPDTMMAHLAGALGRPTWTLLPREADWRWLEGRSDSPWYPSMRLFRQSLASDWRSVVQDVRGALQCVR
jgi:hypothetical protein